MDRSDNAKQISRADRQLSMHPRLRLRGRSGSCFHFAPVGNGGGGQAKIELMYNTVTVSSSVRDASSGPTPLHPKVQEIDFVSKQKKKKKNQPRRNFSPSRPPRFAFWCFQSGSSEHPHTRRAVQACMHSKWMHDRCSMTVSSSPSSADPLVRSADLTLFFPLRYAFRSRTGCKGLVRISSRIDAMCRRHHQLHARWDLRPAAASVAAASVVVATSVCRVRMASV